MPDSGSVIAITYDTTDDITSSVMFEETWFEIQMAAVPGQFSILVKDPDQILSFSTGKEIWLDVDTTRVYGGYILQATKRYAFPADNTANPDPDAVKSRQWVLSGVDYNILLDKRVLRNTSNYTEDIDKTTAPIDDDDVIRTYFGTYFDIPAGFDFTDTGRILTNHTYTNGYTWDTQGTKMRDVLEDLGTQYGAVYWIDANKQLNFLPVQDTAAGWGLSDHPNNNAWGVGTPTRGFVDGELVEDATAIVNDALVWGGSQWAGDGDIVFAREQNAGSITAHNRWQLGENRVGDENYKSQAEVNGRAKVIVNGSESGVAYGEGSQGLVIPEVQFRASWWGHDVPTDAGVRQHLMPGQVVPVELDVFDSIVNIPLRSVRISFPELDPATTPSTAWVTFQGFFGVLMSDPNWLWSYLRSISGKSVPSKKNPPLVVGISTNLSVNPTYGSFYSDVPSPATDGATTVFTIPFSYIPGSLEVYLNGMIQRRDVDYTESDPANGEFTMLVAPDSVDTLWTRAITA